MISVHQSSKSIGLSIYWFAAVIVACFAAAIVYVLIHASGVATQVRDDVEQKLVANEFANQMQQLAHDQSQISHWDDMVHAVKTDRSEQFLRSEVARWIWEDFGVQYTIVVAPDLMPEAVIFEYDTLHRTHGETITVQHSDLILRAQENYLNSRVAYGAGFQTSGHPVRSDNPIDVRAVREVDGQVGIVAVQAIVPHHQQHLEDGAPHTLVTFKPLSENTVALMGERLTVSDLKLVPDTQTLLTDVSSFPIGNEAKGKGFRAVWKSSSPAASMWDGTVGLLTILFGAAALAMFAISRRHSRALVTLKESEEASRFMAYHDNLTGLPNRVQFDAKLGELMKRRADGHYAVMCVDLDHFKAVNDTYGHHAGDTVLKVAADRLAQSVGDSGMVARVGGDEFVVVLWNNLERSSVHWLADDIVERICREIPFEGGKALIGASVGVAFTPDDAVTAKELLQKADRALYQAKEKGRSLSCFYDEIPAFNEADQPIDAEQRA